MNDIRYHALGLHAAVNGLELSLRAARSHEHQQANNERRLQRRARRRQRRAVRRGREEYTTAV